MDQKIKQIVRDYKKKLAGLGIIAEKSLIFGSYAQGRATKDSDLDLLIISDDFKKMDLWERLCLLGRARKGICRPMEILGLTREEFAEQKTGTFVADEIKARAVEI
jgi:hypothetical protein